MIPIGIQRNEKRNFHNCEDKWQKLSSRFTTALVKERRFEEFLPFFAVRKPQVSFVTAKCCHHRL